jgi:hypothetical protein
LLVESLATGNNSVWDCEKYYFDQFDTNNLTTLALLELD